MFYFIDLLNIIYIMDLKLPDAKKIYYILKYYGIDLHEPVAEVYNIFIDATDKLYWKYISGNIYGTLSLALRSKITGTLWPIKAEYCEDIANFIRQDTSDFNILKLSVRSSAEACDIIHTKPFMSKYKLNLGDFSDLEHEEVKI